MFTCGRFSVNLDPLKPDDHTTVFIAPAINTFVLHVPSVDDAVHDIVELGFLFGFIQLERLRVVVQRKWNILVFVLPKVRGLTTKRKTVCCTWPNQIAVVVGINSTTIGKELLHTAFRHLLPQHCV